MFSWWLASGHCLAERWTLSPVWGHVHSEKEETESFLEERLCIRPHTSFSKFSISCYWEGVFLQDATTTMFKDVISRSWAELVAISQVLRPKCSMNTQSWRSTQSLLDFVSYLVGHYLKQCPDFQISSEFVTDSNQGPNTSACSWALRGMHQQRVSILLITRGFTNDLVSQ